MSKRIQNILKIIQENQKVSINRALQVFLEEYKKFSARFDETIELVVKLKSLSQKNSTELRLNMTFPYIKWKKITIAAIVEQDDIESVQRNSSADFVGADDLIAQIQNKEINFDYYVTTPACMPKFIQLAKILGPRGIMPNTKNGTIDIDVTKAIQNIRNGQITFKTDKAGIINIGIGKLSSIKANLVSNIIAIKDTILNAKPEKLKGEFIRGVYISTTQGPSIELDLKEFMN